MPIQAASSFKFRVGGLDRSTFAPRRYLTLKKIIAAKTLSEKNRLRPSRTAKIVSVCPEMVEALSGRVCIAVTSQPPAQAADLADFCVHVADLVGGRFDQPQPQVFHRKADPVEVPRNLALRGEQHDSAGMCKLPGLGIVGVLKANRLRQPINRLP